MSLARRLLFAFAFLCLTGAQQAAFAHWAAHLAAPLEATLEAPDGEHTATTTLTQLCKGCLAYTGLDAALPAAPPPTAAPGAIVAHAASAPRAIALAAARPFDSRAPPAFL